MRWMAGLSVLLFLACGTTAPQRSPGSASPPSPEAAPTAASTTAPEAGPTNQEINDRFVQQISERIAGRENEPAEQVFKNIKWFKGVPAGRLLRIMNRGYSHALGVSCTHCHLEEDFASDEKRPKRAAREMAAMHRMINQQLKGMKNLETPPEKLAINCSTCHRGAIDPMARQR